MGRISASSCLVKVLEQRQPTFQVLSSFACLQQECGPRSSNSDKFRWVVHLSAGKRARVGPRDASPSTLHSYRSIVCRRHSCALSLGPVIEIVSIQML